MSDDQIRRLAGLIEDLGRAFGEGGEALGSIADLLRDVAPAVQPEVPPVPPVVPVPSVTLVGPLVVDGSTVTASFRVDGDTAKVSGLMGWVDEGNAVHGVHGMGQRVGTSGTVSFSDLPPGPHTLSVGLLDMNGFLIDSSVSFTRFEVVAVRPEPVTPPLKVVTVEVRVEPAMPLVGTVAQATAIARGLDGSQVSTAGIVWSTDDRSVATVDATGLVTALKAGTATIAATVDGVAGKTDVMVMAPEVVPPSPPPVVPPTEPTPAPPSDHDHDPPKVKPGKGKGRTAQASGFWSEPAIWGPDGPPAEGDSVTIPNGVHLVFDLKESPLLGDITIAAGGGLARSTLVSTSLRYTTLWLLPGGLYWGGDTVNPIRPDVRCETVFVDSPFDPDADPDQKGHGLYVQGKVFIHGAVKTPFVRLAVEPLAGHTTLSLAEPVSGWRPGDVLCLPDTRHLWDGIRWAKYVPQWETIHINSIAADGRSVTLAVPLQFDHRGARDGAGVLEFLPHVGNLSRNVVFRSQNPDGVRGHTLYTERAEVQIRWAEFLDLGRTTADPTGPQNRIGRYGVHFHHLMGVARPDAVWDDIALSPQFVIGGCSVWNWNYPHRHRWAISVHNSHGGLVANNVVFNLAGAGIVCEDGPESFNYFIRNFACGVVGFDNPRQNTGNDGSGFWARGFNNIWRDNVAASCSDIGYQGIVTGVGFNIGWWAASKKDMRIPKFPGADLTIDGQYELVDMQLVPIREFARNEAYGAMSTGLTLWHLGTDGYSDRMIQPDGTRLTGSTVRDFAAWHCWGEGFFGYPIQDVTFDGFIVRGDPRFWGEGQGWTSGDYWAGNITLRRADIQGMHRAVMVAGNTPGTFRIEDSYFRNLTANIEVSTQSTPGAAAPKHPRKTYIDRCFFDPWDSTKYDAGSYYKQQFSAIAMLYDPTYINTDLILPDEVFVTAFNGVLGDNFRVYYSQQAPNMIVPASGSVPGLVGAPEPGLTNQQLWEKYGIAIAGAVAPKDAKPRPGILGLVAPL